jgi:dolichol-phosphate mannosyltransferase
MGSDAGSWLLTLSIRNCLPKREVGPRGIVDIRQERVSKASAAILPEPWCSSDVVVVLPTYQEAANLPVIVAALFDLPLAGLRIQVVDDESPDGTGQIAEELADHYGRYRLGIVHRAGKEGLGRAYVDGMSRAIAGGAEFVVQMDSDMSHAPQYLPQMLGTLLSTDADVVTGSRYVAGASIGVEWPWYRSMLSRFANAYVRLLLQMEIRDVTAGYKLWRASALDSIGLQTVRSNGYSFQVEMTYRSVRQNLRIIELPIHFSDRTQGQSKMSLKVQLESAFMPFKLRRYLRRWLP